MQEPRSRIELVALFARQPQAMRLPFRSDRRVTFKSRVVKAQPWIAAHFGFHVFEHVEHISPLAEGHAE